MDAVNIGPLLLDSERLVFIVGFAVMLIAAHALGGVVRSALVNWVWRAATVGILVARVGYVLLHLDAFAAEPLSVLYVWQGGFNAWFGIAGAALHTLYSMRDEPALFRRAVMTAGVGLVALVAAIGVLQPSGITGTGGEPLPAVTLYRIEDNAPIALGELAGTPTVINIWATWCPPCRREMPLLAETAAGYPGVRFVFADQGESANLVRSFLVTLPCDLSNVLLDPDRSLGAAVGVVGLPTTLFYDTAGRLVSRQVGELSRASLGDHLAAITPAAPAVTPGAPGPSTQPCAGSPARLSPSASRRLRLPAVKRPFASTARAALSRDVPNQGYGQADEVLS